MSNHLVAKRIAMIDGVIAPLEHARVSVLDRGFLYGDSVFETIRTYDGRPFALGRHLARLEHSAELVHIPLPLPLSELRREVLEAVAAAGFPESYVRLMITRGQGELGLDPALAEKPLRVVLVQPLSPPPAEAYAKGIGAVTHATRRASDATLAAGAKIGNYLVSVLAVREARREGASEALIVDAEGRVVEGATSNVFFVRGKTLVTPPEDAGILAGISRAIVLDVAQDSDFTVELRAPLTSELDGFDEVFISSSIREMLAVVRLDGRAVGTGAPGPAYERLLRAFRLRARDPAYAD
jgi:branched-chain amino acid aminotransferase